MSTPPPDDRDLRLARRLDAGEAADGPDPLHDALRAAQPSPPPVGDGTSARLWERIEAATRADRSGAGDRPPLRLVRTQPVRWLAAAVVLVALGAGLWLLRSGPEAVAVAEAEIVTYEAPDGSTVVLRPHSRLVRLDDDARAYGLEGEAFFSVVSDAERPFTVEAGAAEVRVLGTRFDVSTWAGPVEVFVEEGRVRVSAAGEAVELAAGEAVAANAAGVRALPGARAEAFLDWRRGELVFERTPLARVADEVGQHFDVVLLLPGPIAQQSVSGVIPLGSEAQVLGDLGRILGGRFEAAESGYRFVQP